jgi:hypothetical protein
MGLGLRHKPSVQLHITYPPITVRGILSCLYPVIDVWSRIVLALDVA